MAKTTNDMDPLASIDLHMIDALKELRQEADVLRDRLASLEGMKGELADAVYQRVRTDYQGKRDAIARQSAPLREQARSTWAGLRDALARIDREHEAVRLDQQENDLRHKLGEFDDDEYAKRCKDIEATLAERARAHDRAAGLRARFLEVFDSEAELEAPVAAPAGPASTQELPPAGDAAIADAEAPQPPPAPTSVASTQILSALNLPQPPRAPAKAAKAAPVEPNATAFFRTARLVPQSPEAGRKATPLPPRPVVLGADTAADIRIGGPGVDPQHARIEPNAKGYTLVDLGSQYGTRVNAEPAREHVLHDEDVIQIGAARFVFRED